MSAFLDIGFGELVVVAFVGLVLYGGRLPEMMRTMGSSYRKLRRSVEDLTRQATTPEPPRPAYRPEPPKATDALPRPAPSPDAAPAAPVAPPSAGSPSPASGPGASRPETALPRPVDDDAPLV